MVLRKKKVRSEDKPSSWTVANCELVYEEIQAEARDIHRTRPEELTKSLLASISAYELRHSRWGQLKRFYYVLEVLQWQSTLGELPQRLAKDLLELAEGLLQANGIKPGVSKLSFMWAELSRVRCFHNLARGQNWVAAFEQQAAYHLAKRSRELDKSRIALTSAQVALRLGQTDLAETYARHALDPEADVRHDRAAKITLGTALMLQGKGQEAGEWFAPIPTPAAEWLRQWNTCLITGETDPTLLVSATRKGKPCYEADCILEAHLAAYASPTLAPLKHVPKIRTLTRRKDLSLHRSGQLYKGTIAVEAMYDYEVPLETRLEGLLQALSRPSELPSMMAEILIWAAAARALARVQALHVAVLALRQMRQLSLAVSLGKDQDILRLTADLLAKPWFSDPAAGSGPVDLEEAG